MVVHAFARSAGKNISDITESIELFQSVSKFRQTLAVAFTKAHGLSLRPELDMHVEDIANDDVGVITINWDELLWKREKINLIQLHGRASASESLILPMEQISDDFIFEVLSLFNASNIDLSTLGSVFRKEYQKMLTEAEKLAFSWTYAAKELVLYGIALNAYDAEMLQVLRQWNNTRALGYEQTRLGGRPNLMVVNPTWKNAEDSARFLCVREFLWIHPIEKTSYIMYLKDGNYIKQ